MQWLGSPSGDAWFYFFVYRCAPPPHWEPAYVRGPEWMSDDAGQRYGPDLSYYAGFTDEAMIVDTWRLEPGGQWRQIGWSAAGCHTGARPI
jgi:hypothetical protein